MSANQNRQELEASLIAKAWKSEDFRQELISDPKTVYARELGQVMPENLTIQVLEETPGHIYIVLPKTPQLSEELSDEALEAIAGGGGCVLVTWFDQ